MREGLLSWRWSHCPYGPYSTIFSMPFSNSVKPRLSGPKFSIVRIALNSVEESPMTARERRQMRNDRRESMPAYNWREDVEIRLIKKNKKRYASWTEELNLDSLASLGPQWWVVRVSRATGQDIAEAMAISMARNFPAIEFKVYVPSVHVKRKLKNGTISVKPKPLFPGCVFLRCVMNKELHEFIRECNGVGGFVGSKVGNMKKSINRPRPVDAEDIEGIFKQAKEEQEKADRTFEEEQKTEDALDSKKLSGLTSLKKTTKPTGKRRKAASFKLGSTVQVLSGSFTGFSGTIKKLDIKTGLATVGLTLFGKETLADIDTRDILPEAINDEKTLPNAN